MTTLKTSFTMFRGDTAAKVLTIRKPNHPFDVVPLTGLTLEIAAHPDEEPADATGQIFVKAMTLVDAANGQASFALSAGDWGSIGAGDYFFDIQATDSGGAIETLAKGKFEIVQDINKG